MHEAKYNRLTLREAGVTTILESLNPSEHQTTSMLNFHEYGWDLPTDFTPEYLTGDTVNPFLMENIGIEDEYQPADSRIHLTKILDRWEEFIDQDGIDNLDKPVNTVYNFFPSATHHFCDLSEGKSKTESFMNERGGLIDLPAPSPTPVAGVKWKKDEWKRGHNCWIRVHHKPRKAMFVPTGTKDGPPVKVLSGERSTKVDYCNGSKSEIVNDDWLSKHNRCLDSLWTGCLLYTSPSPRD